MHSPSAPLLCSEKAGPKKLWACFAHPGTCSKPTFRVQLSTLSKTKPDVALQPKKPNALVNGWIQNCCGNGTRIPSAVPEQLMEKAECFM